MAKLASVHCKPDGLLVIPADGSLEFLHPLPVSALWGVGEQTGKTLARLGLRTVGDIAAYPARRPWSVSWARRRPRTCPRWPGAGTTAGSSHRCREKSVGAEETFATDISDPEVIRRELLRLSRRTAQGAAVVRVRRPDCLIKLRKADFTTITRSKTLPEPTNETQRIYATACALYAASGLSGQARLRLVGVRATGLVLAEAAATQLALGEHGASWRDAESALDRITGRFGPEAVRPASLVDPGAGRPLQQPAGRAVAGVAGVGKVMTDGSCAITEFRARGRVPFHRAPWRSYSGH